MPASVRSAKAYRHLQSKLRRKTTRRRAVRIGLVLSNVVILGVILVFVLQTPHSGSSVTGAPALLNSGAVSAVANPLDQVSSTDIAQTVAQLDALPETTAIINQADSQRLEANIASTDDNVLTKPQVVATSLKSRADIQTYTVIAGDSVPSLAAKFGITSESIRLSNNLGGDGLSPGQKLVIPPVSGIVYTVKAGDTADSLAQKYNVSKDKIIAYNDAEISGLQVGEQIILPDATQPTAIGGYGYSAGLGFAWGGGAIYGSNGYDPGNCTWYAANRRIAAGDPVPANLGNAESWLIGAQFAGIPTGRVPKAGAVIWYNPYSGPFHRSDTAGQVYRVGHVGYVDSVDSSGNVHLTEMNVEGLYSIITKVLSPSDAQQYWYIY